MPDFAGNMLQDIIAATRDGHPPLYVQMMLVTMLFIILRLYVLVRRRRRAATPPNEWLMGGYLGLLALLSLGVWDHLQMFYRDYVLHTVRVLIG